MTPDPAPKRPDGGRLPDWETDELPAPPPFSLRQLVKVIGPGAILLASSIGGGEWLVAPAAAVKYGTGLLGIATIAIALQVVFNLEAVRYTLYTGEPIYTAFMRLAPGPTFWALFYSLIAIAQLAWPALGLAAAGTLFSATSGRLPGADPADAGFMQLVASGLVLLTAVLLLFGGTVERMLERLSWIMLVFIFGFLVAVNVLFVPLPHWLRTLGGFVTMSGLPPDVDWGLMAALAATAGSGGVGNLTITNWIRDKGFGMGSRVGAIASAVGGRHTTVSPLGRVFAVTPEALARWREWWRYVVFDQVWLWGFFCFVGLFLTVNLATAVVPRGTDLQGLATGAYQAEYMARHMWAGLWYLTLVNGFWIMYSTHLGNTDILVRTVTDVLWVGNPGLRSALAGRVSLLYYGLLAAFSLWALYALRMAGPFALFKILANVAGLVLAIAGLQVLVANRRFLPPALRPPLWRELLLVGCSAFYGFFTLRAAASLFAR